MFLHKTTKKVGSKTHHSFLLSESYREKGKVKHRVIANLSRWPRPLIDAVATALKGQKLSSPEDLPLRSGKNFGGLFVLLRLAKELFIDKLLGNSRKGKLAMLLILGRILTQGSRRHLTFWKEGQATQETIGISSFDEDDLYETLDWLDTHQKKIEDQWFRLRFKNQKVELFLYDVTSSYLEGSCNELAEYGYNRDGKKGKKQIVIGLLTVSDGSPVAVEVFRGNTADITTVPDQIKKMAERFGVAEVTLVGDRGMIKKIPIELLQEYGWHYITAITKPQIESLIQKGIFQLGLFEEKLYEIEQKGIRYFLRRNPQRADEIQKNRQEKIQKIESLLDKLNEKLKEKPRAKSESAVRELQNKIVQLKLGGILKAEAKERKLILSTDQEQLEKASELDGCYVIKTDLSREKIGAEAAHETYKDLSQVEWAFRTMKTGLLEIRPLYHRKANRTRACALVAMLAYAITRHLWKKTSQTGKPLDTILSSLDQIQIQEMQIKDRWIKIVPTHFRKDQEEILQALNIKFSKSLPQKEELKV